MSANSVCTLGILKGVIPQLANYPDLIVQRVLIEAKYAAILFQQRKNIETLQQYENIQIPESLDYASFSFLSEEAKQRLLKVKPTSFAALKSMDGIGSEVFLHLYKYMTRLQNN